MGLGNVISSSIITQEENNEDDEMSRVEYKWTVKVGYAKFGRCLC